MVLRTKALFLDRDGVINQDIGYLYRPDDFEFMPGIFSLCRKAKRKGYKIVVVTNQSGIARGYYSREQFHHLSRWMTHQFWLQGVKVHDVNYCPHHPKVEGVLGVSCRCRKPRPGMLVETAHRQGLSLPDSLMVGDKLSDMVAARHAGIGARFLYRPDDVHSLPKKGLPKRPNGRYTFVTSLRQIEAFL